MIQITAYLRNEEDLARWKALENKTEWLHDCLSGKEALRTVPPRVVEGKAPRAGDILNSTPKLQIVKLENIPRLKTAAELNEPECPRHHIPKNLCIGRH